jgi:hypothetical protein
MPNLTHIIDKHEGAKKVVNILYEETAEKINAKQPNRAKKIGRRRRRWCIVLPRAGRMRCRDEGREEKVSAGNVVWCQTGGVRWSNYLQISPHAEEVAGLLRRHGGCEDTGLVWQLYAPPATR